MPDNPGAIITRLIEIDAGHRVPHHGSKCKHLHGHRYRFTLAVHGPVQADLGQSEAGMVTDFGVLKQCLVETVDGPWDHRLLLYELDEFAGRIAGHPLLAGTAAYHGPSVADLGVVLVPFVPTAENLAREVWERAQVWLDQHGVTDLQVAWVECRETPNCTARFPA